ncbi:hypothetical protein [Polaromonas sp. YR568]
MPPEAHPNAAARNVDESQMDVWNDRAESSIDRCGLRCADHEVAR